MSDNQMNFGPNQPGQSSQGNHPGQYYPMINPYETITRMGRDMRFMAYYSMISGALICLTIIGALWGVPLFIAGLRLRDAADKFDEHLRTNDFQAIYQGFERQRTYFLINKIFIIIGLVFMVLYFGFIIMLVSTGSLNNLGNW